MRGKLLVLSLFFLLMVGCGLKPPAFVLNRLNLDFPSTWSNSDEASQGIDLSWGKEFKDPELLSLIQEALSSNLNLKAMELLGLFQD